MKWDVPKINTYLATQVMGWPVVDLGGMYYKSGKDLGYAIFAQNYSPCEDFDLAIKAFRKISGLNLLWLGQDYEEGWEVWHASCHEGGDPYSASAESPSMAICLLTLALTGEDLEGYKASETVREDT